MPWRIRKTVLTGGVPTLHMWDETVNLHLVTDLGNGVVDLYIGDSDPTVASILITIDVDHDPVVELVRASKCTPRQVSIITNVLKSMDIDYRIRNPIVERLQQKCSRRPAHRGSPNRKPPRGFAHD